VEGAGGGHRLYAGDAAGPNRRGGVAGGGEAPPLLRFGDADVVSVEGQRGRHPPFGAEQAGGFLWGRGALDMKGALAMFTGALLATRDAPPPGDVLLAVLSDEEAGAREGAEFLVERHPQLFAGVRHALGELGGFTMHVRGRRLYPVMVAEKQVCRVIATVRGPGGHGSLPHRGGAMARLAALLGTLDRRRLPRHLTPAARLMRRGLEAALAPAGPPPALLEPVLRNTVNATVVRGGAKSNVIPSEITLELDARMLPGFEPEHLLAELRVLAGPDVELEYDRYNPGRAPLDTSQYEMLAAILREMDAGARPFPNLFPASTDGRFLARLGIQTYGFTPMRLPRGLDFMATIHAADERIPLEAVADGIRAVSQAILRYR